MSHYLAVTRLAGETLVAVLDGDRLLELHREKGEADNLVGNIYLSRVDQILSGMDAAFVDLGLQERQGYLSSKQYGPFGGNTVRPWAGLKKGQPLLVQVVKDPGPEKGLTVTTGINLPGRSLVFLPYGNKVMTSRKIEDLEGISRLQHWVKRYLPDETGAIIRTAAWDATEDEIRREIGYLCELWRLIREKSAELQPPSLLYCETDLVDRIFRDFIRPEISEILVDDSELFRQFFAYNRESAAGRKIEIRLWREDEPLFSAGQIMGQLNEALRKKIWLPSGGYLIIEEMETLTAIDVNTGKNIKRRNLSQTLSEVNLEAVKEVARQIRLRNIGGIIVIDFGGIPDVSEQAVLVEALKQAAAGDPQYIKIIGFTPLGLMELTRRKRYPSLSRMWLADCPCCQGKGRVLPAAAQALTVEDLLTRKAAALDGEALGFAVNPKMAAALTGKGGSGLERISARTGKEIFLAPDEKMALDEISLLASGNRQEVWERLYPFQIGTELEVRITERHKERKNCGIARPGGFLIEVPGAADRINKITRVRIKELYRTYGIAEIITADAGDGL
ncbi:MAG: Rne/Rng family ribonuclease [Bacillota bacterium]